jgi:hypothetical protein
MPLCFSEVSDKFLFVVNVILVVGIVFGLLFAIGINNENKKLALENQRQRSREDCTDPSLDEKQEMN